MATASDSLRRARPLLGTFVEIRVAGAPLSDMEVAIESAFCAVARVHRLMSFHEPDSDLGRLNRDAASRPVSVDPWTMCVLRTAIDLHRRSRGAFDIAVAPVLQSMGLLPPSARLRRRKTARPPTAASVELLPGNRVRFHGPLVLDLGGIAKGFAVDRALAALRACGMRQALVNAGGDLAAFGPRPEAVHIRDPRNPDRVICQVDVRDQALASSGGRFDPMRSPHTAAAAIIDPRGRCPPAAVCGATVRAPSCMIADALTKIAMIAGESALDMLTAFHADAILIAADGSLHVTPERQGAVHRAA
jgi:thiamine biosynthesis lipoprotein